ncbi:MAG: beta-N-acetylhexosaminidase [Treponema sp.]|jgi:hexosaminidase|nr:beta-N-acetylhexosaminidase [Treponema sp.]
MESRISLLPEPQHMQLHDGRFVFSDTVIYARSAEFCKNKTEFYCTYLSGLNFSLDFSTPAKKDTGLQIVKNDSIVNIEGYSLNIATSGITIGACSPAGVFYAFVTLKQLLMTNEHSLPALSIEDEPLCRWRGFMLDTCRSFYSIGFIKKMLDALAFHKFNRFHWHLTDDQGWRIAVPEYPLLTEIGAIRFDNRLVPAESKVTGGVPGKGFYEDAEICDVVKYAADRNITVVPEIELPGHSSALLAAYPEMGCTGGPYRVEDRFGIFPDVVCCGNDALFTLYDSVFKTIDRLFPGKWVHIGGDECLTGRWKSCPKCQKRIRQEHLKDEKELQPWITVQIAKLLESYAKIPVGWDEVLNGTQKLGLPDSLIVQSWRGTDGGLHAAAANHYVIMSPQTQGCYLNFKNYADENEPGRLGVATVKNSYDFTPIPAGLTELQKSYFLGGECNLWTEELPYSRIAEYLLFPRLCAISESLWLPQDKKDFTRFCADMQDHKERLHAMDFLYYDGPYA